MRTPQWLKRVAQPIASQLVYASSAYVDVKSTLNDLGSTLISFDNEPGGDADEQLLRAAHLITPKLPKTARLIRVGGPHDGGYVMADDFLVSGAISIGVGPDVSWDQDVARRGVPVVMFDPTIRRPPDHVTGSRFYRVGISGTPVGTNFRPLADLVTVAGFSRQEDLLLKIDVEGAEWASLSGLSISDLQQFRQIAIELHGLSALGSTSTNGSLFEALNILASGHLPIHVHANNYSRLVRFNRYWFPDAIEVTYLRKDIAGSELSPAKLPSELDAPCDPRVADVSLRGLASLAKAQD